jgi:ABC-2 type transport system ATP-binding protein
MQGQGMDTAAIRVTGLVKRYHGSDEDTVNGLDLEVCEGEIFGLLGPNGAGKTTTLSIVCGLLKATGGSVEVLSVDVARHPGRIKHLLGFVPQDIALYPTLTGRENLEFFGRMHGLYGAALKKRVDELLAVVGLEKSARRKVATYSGGMKRRANLAAGIIHEPRLLILDEPTVGIDAQSRGLIFENLRELAGAGKTMVYATHYMEEAQKLCTRVAIMDSGRVLQQGPPAQLIAARPGARNLEELFLELTGRSLRD